MRNRRCAMLRRVAAKAKAAWILLLGLALTGPSCNRPEQARAVAGGQAQPAAPVASDQDQATAADASRKKAPDPIDVDAERVLTGMPAAWRDMLAKAEDFNRRERVGWCTTCHVNIRDQLRGGEHDKNSISCVECHGASERHARNENNEVKPDQGFARQDVDRVCGDCHDCSRSEPAAEAAPTTFVCTDCHPAHKFPNLAAPPPK